MNECQVAVAAVNARKSAPAAAIQLSFELARYTRLLGLDMKVGKGGGRPFF